MIKDDRLPKKEAYLSYLENVPIHKWACKAVMISQSTSERWREEDKDFADMCEAKISSWVGRTLKQAKAEFKLERIMREDFKPPVDEHTVEVKPLVILDVHNRTKTEHVESDKSTAKATDST